MNPLAQILASICDIMLDLKASRSHRLLFAALALVLALYTFISIDMNWKTRWLFKKDVSIRRHKILAVYRVSTSGTKNNERLMNPNISIALLQLSSKAAHALTWNTTTPDDVRTAPATFPPPRSPAMYVRSSQMGSGQLGNSMFEYISSYVVAKRLGLNFVVLAAGKQLRAYELMSSLFNITAKLHSENFPVDRVVREQGWGIYTASVVKNESYGSYTKIRGWLQSWRYFAGFEDFVRKEFALTYRFRTYVNDFFIKNGVHQIAGERGNATLIAVHVRRGDMLALRRKYLMASPEYLVQAITYFRSKYADHRPTFVVATDDKPWTRAIVDSVLHNDSVPVIYANGTALEDMAVLSSCHHAIITGGTYGWWAAWLAGGNVMYFRDFIWNGSDEWRNYNAADYYPPPWIGRS